ncbi:MAG: superoxide dismutase [Flavobacteriales bacterium]|nr:superoxide dismutase [Flavobacteriales bacterium]
MERRKFVIQTTLLTGSIAALPFWSIGKYGDGEESVFSLPDLPYGFDALEPMIDEKTMRIHHGKHFKGYTDKLNKAIERTPFANQSIEDILQSISASDTAIRNNGGGYYNHALYFASLSPNPKTRPSGKLMDALERDFGSFESFKEMFTTKALGVFGSGWAWLTKNDVGELAIVSTPNQDNPLMSFVADRGLPLMGIDVWEHAYYLNYQNERNAYIDAFFKVIDWEFVEEKFN